MVPFKLIYMLKCRIYRPTREQLKLKSWIVSFPSRPSQLLLLLLLDVGTKRDIKKKMKAWVLITVPEFSLIIVNRLIICLNFIGNKRNNIYVLHHPTMNVVNIVYCKMYT